MNDGRPEPSPTRQPACSFRMSTGSIVRPRMVFGPSRVGFQHANRAIAVPRIAVAAFLGDFGDVVVDGFVAVAEEWAIAVYF